MRYITKVTPAGLNDRGDDHQVVRIESKGTRGACRKKPCPSCPWRKDAVGEFPAEAFRISAGTAYDASMELFGCHESGVDKPATCAGFMLRNADNNIRARMLKMSGVGLEVEEGDAPLHESYRAMAIANGVSPDDPVLAPCRDNS